MSRLEYCVATVMSVASPAFLLRPQKADPITTSEIDAPVKFLSSDLLEGSAPDGRARALAR